MILTDLFSKSRCADAHHSEVPTLLHFAAQHGLINLGSVLLQCPGAVRAVQTVNRHGHTPIQIARNYGHNELHILLKETLVTLLIKSKISSFYL